MHYIVDSRKSVEQACADLETAVRANNFGVLHVHDLRATMMKKGVDFDRECRIFEVCNPQQAKKVLEEDMTLNLALPCRISVWEEGGTTKIGMLLPSAMLRFLSPSPSLGLIAEEVESVTKRIIDSAK